MKSKIIAQGAEATLTLKNSHVIKTRTRKSYRHPDLDKKLRKRRTKAESKILQKASNLIPTPELIESSESKSQIQMSYIKGLKLSEHLDKMKDYQKVCKLIGKNLALLHNSGIIHGDLTTSNMILTTSRAGRRVKPLDKTLFFIDFGLSFHSDRAEDKAVDLHLISQALEAKHSSIFKKAFSSVLQGYKSKSDNYNNIITRLKKVEKRGRYKKQY